MKTDRKPASPTLTDPDIEPGQSLELLKALFPYTGHARIIGLTGISQTPETPKGAAPTPAPGKTCVFRPEAKMYKVESDDFGLGPGEGIEMKYHMQRGAELV